MKHDKTIFQKLIEPINSRPIGMIISRQEILQESEVPGCYDIDVMRYMLSKTGFISHYIKKRRGHYKILRHVPTFLTSELTEKLYNDDYWYTTSKSKISYYKRDFERKTKKYSHLIEPIWIRLKKFINEKQINDEFALSDLKEFFEVPGSRTRLVRLFLFGLLSKRILVFHGPDNYVIKEKIDSDVDGSLFLHCICSDDWTSWFIKVKE